MLSDIMRMRPGRAQKELHIPNAYQLLDGLVSEFSPRRQLWPQKSPKKYWLHYPDLESLPFEILDPQQNSMVLLRYSQAMQNFASDSHIFTPFCISGI